MAIQTTQWSPDTCGCVLQYTWDDAVPDSEREHTGSKVVKACEHHPFDHEVDDPHEHLTKVHAECYTKNVAIAALLENAPVELTKEVQDADGNTIKQFLKEPKWSFDKNRQVVIDHPDLQEKDKAEILSKVATVLEESPIETKAVSLK